MLPFLSNFLGLFTLSSLTPEELEEPGAQNEAKTKAKTKENIYWCDGQPHCPPRRFLASSFFASFSRHPSFVAFLFSCSSFCSACCRFVWLNGCTSLVSTAWGLQYIIREGTVNLPVYMLSFKNIFANSQQLLGGG